MKKPKGFAKNYFSLSAILAYSTLPRLEAQRTASATLFHTYFDINEEEFPPEEDLFETPLILDSNPCHCNCVFKLKIRLILLLNHFIPRCSYYTKYFAFRRTGVHPPL